MHDFLCNIFHVFSRMRSKGSRSLCLGVWGVELCSPDVAFTSATVRNRPREDHMAVPMVSSAKGVTFGGFQRRVAYHFAWQAQHFRRVVLRAFCESYCQLREVVTRCKFRGRSGIL